MYAHTSKKWKKRRELDYYAFLGSKGNNLLVFFLYSWYSSLSSNLFLANGIPETSEKEEKETF